jgi:hypothetical protein
MASVIKADVWQSTSGNTFNSVLQVVDTYFTLPTSQAMPGGTTYNDITGISATIVPKSATSKIMIFARWWGEHGEAGQSWNSMFSVKRNGTPIGQPGQPGSLRIGMTSSALSYYAGDNDSTGDSMNLFYLDSPASTTAVTYQLCIMNETTYTIYTNRCVNATASGGYERGTSSIVLMEIAA